MVDVNPFLQYSLAERLKAPTRLIRPPSSSFLSSISLLILTYLPTYLPNPPHLPTSSASGQLAKTCGGSKSICFLEKIGRDAKLLYYDSLSFGPPPPRSQQAARPGTMLRGRWWPGGSQSMRSHRLAGPSPSEPGIRLVITCVFVCVCVCVCVCE